MISPLTDHNLSLTLTKSSAAEHNQSDKHNVLPDILSEKKYIFR